MDVRVEPDYRELLRGVPELYLILSSGLTIIDTTDAYLSATKTRRENIVGRGIFDVFPDSPDNMAKTGADSLRTSLEFVLKERRPHVMAVQRYDLIVNSMAVPHDPAGPGYEIRYWSPINTPVLAPEGEVRWIIHRVQDVTEFIRLQEAKETQATVLQDRMQLVEAEVYRSAQ